MSFQDFFFKATNHNPFRYQIELGEEPLRSRVIRVPTGGGKTEAAVIPWLWKTTNDPGSAPKRLVIFSPMRSLVSQTVGRIESCLKNLGRSKEIALIELLGEHPELRERNREWTEKPERPTILVGTVDLLLSAALNRGYAMSRFRWPVAFGMLHNSALWIVDEVQLMGAATSTFSQLEQFRTKFGTMFPVFTWWMSATVEPEWLATVDFDPPTSVTPADTEALVKDLGIKYTARKPLRQDPALDARSVLRAHAHPKRLTLVVVNTVKAARELYRSIEAPVAPRQKKSTQKSPAGSPKLVLIHSRFRPVDRKQKMDQLIEADKALRPGSANSEKYPLGVIVIATQVVEAGIDVSAQTLITELAPWPSIVQRFGRLNRTGKEPAAQALWVDVKDPAPYSPAEIKAARERLKSLEDVGPASLAEKELPPQEKQESVIREHDFLGLFSTNKDLAGGFTDISPYIRDSDDSDVYIGWRDFSKTPNGIAPESELEAYELCAVPISDARRFRSDGNPLWEWNDETGLWETRSAPELVCGMTLLCAVSNGGYSVDQGWTGMSQDQPVVADKPPRPQNDSNNRDPSSLTVSQWRKLGAHLIDVEKAARQICERLSMDPALSESLALAARWHDIGKSVPDWQRAVKLAIQRSNKPYREGMWAKFPANKGTFRPALRHEEASALYGAKLLEDAQPGWNELAVYLIACHHGKVRTTLGTYGVTSLRKIRDLTVHLAGVLEEPVKLNCDLLDFSGAGEYQPATSQMVIRGRSWASLVASLVGSEDGANGANAALGPFRLAFLEALLVAADIRASRNPEDLDG
jgi:CRISPR-associated endonuclease/helicase Cas3